MTKQHWNQILKGCRDVVSDKSCSLDVEVVREHYQGADPDKSQSSRF